MSSEEENQTLPESLEKLELSTKITAELTSTNPFLKNFENNFNLLNPNGEDLKIKLFGPKCECDQKENTKIEHVIKNTIQFKTKQHKKSLLKEPMLKFIGKCMHKNHIKHKRSKSENSSILDKTDDLDKSNSRIFSSRSLFGGNNIEHSLDFSSLAKEYSSLTLVQNSNSSKNNESFSKKYLSRSSLPSIKISESNTSQNHQQNHSSSCSQQARINVNSITSCDITIDELACYFETFVHIPKKMSKMAEMMYI